MNWIFKPNGQNLPVAVVLGAGNESQTLASVLAAPPQGEAWKVTSGDTVYFAPGTYHLPAQWGTEFSLSSWEPNLTTQLGTLQGVATTFAKLPVGLNGTPDAPITFEGILDAEGNMPTIDGRGYFRSCAFRVNGSHLTFRNFRIIGCQIGFHINGGPAKDGIRIENCEVGEYGTATKRLTVFYQDPNNAAVTSVTPNVLAKPPIAGDSDDNYPLGVECDWSTSNLTIGTCQQL